MAVEVLVESLNAVAIQNCLAEPSHGIWTIVFLILLVGGGITTAVLEGLGIGRPKGLCGIIAFVCVLLAASILLTLRSRKKVWERTQLVCKILDYDLASISSNFPRGQLSRKAADELTEEQKQSRNELYEQRNRVVMLLGRRPDKILTDVETRDETVVELRKEQQAAIIAHEKFIERSNFVIDKVSNLQVNAEVYDEVRPVSEPPEIKV